MSSTPLSFSAASPATSTPLTQQSSVLIHVGSKHQAEQQIEFTSAPAAAGAGAGARAAIAAIAARAASAVAVAGTVMGSAAEATTNNRAHVAAVAAPQALLYAANGSNNSRYLAELKTASDKEMQDFTEIYGKELADFLELKKKLSEIHQAEQRFFKLAGSVIDFPKVMTIPQIDIKGYILARENITHFALKNKRIFDIRRRQEQGTKDKTSFEFEDTIGFKNKRLSDSEKKEITDSLKKSIEAGEILKNLYQLMCQTRNENELEAIRKQIATLLNRKTSLLFHFFRIKEIVYEGAESRSCCVIL